METVLDYVLTPKDSFLPKVRVWLLATQKPLKRQGWWKGKFALFWMPATPELGLEGGLLSKGQLPPHGDNQWGRAFTGRGRGLRAETARSALTVILKLVIGGLTSVILIVLSTIRLHFQGWFVPFS